MPKAAMGVVMPKAAIIALAVGGFMAYISYLLLKPTPPWDEYADALMEEAYGRLDKD